MSAKRPRPEGSMDTIQAKALRLEAIFHPKFENESQNDDKIRSQMIDGPLAIHVSIKHSGSLLLWSGERKYYSKNALDNGVTVVGEILVRQHFGRVWPQAFHEKYLECCQQLEDSRYTVAFECVTNCLGDHGQRPARDYVVVTAIADRRNQCFLESAELLEFCHRFRLPHNDIWMCTTPESKKKLFALYDAQKEMALTTPFCQALDALANIKIQSVLPHNEWQGEIMEGIVVRQEPSGDLSTFADTAKGIAEKALHLRPCFESITSSSMLSTDIRSLCSPEMTHPQVYDKLVILLDDDCARVSERFNKFDPLAHLELTDMEDAETKQIWQLLKDIQDIKGKVKYVLVKEAGSGRLLCTIHVMFDRTFASYRNKVTSPSAMQLYRGFVFEVVTNSDYNSFMQIASKEDVTQAPLMLKLKFLPYMVRTFGCRNGLRQLKMGGPNAFSVYTRGLLSLWKVSSRARKHWMPIFDAWGKFANGKDQIGNSYLAYLEDFYRLYQDQQVSVTAADDCRFRGLVVVVGMSIEQASTVADYIALKLGKATRVQGAEFNGKSMDMACSYKGQVLALALHEKISALKKAIQDGYDTDISVIKVGFDTVDLSLDTAESKATNGLMKSWNKLHVKLSVEAPTRDLYNVDGSLNESSKVLQTFLSKLPSQGDDEGSGICPALVFFPGIPGCGKSFLVKSSKEELKVVLDAKNRELVLQVGDEMKNKKTFWPSAKHAMRLRTSSVLLADKNAPTWSLIGDVCVAGRAVALPVLPDEHALRSCSITYDCENSMFNSAKKGNRTHSYPYSLAYLAVCLSRVLDRQKGTHAGRLDAGTNRAGLIVINFFCLYRGVSSKEFVETMQDQIEREGGMMSTEAVRVPFFKAEPSLPEDLSVTLQDAINAQYELTYCTEKRQDITKYKDSKLDDLDQAIRAVISKHKDYLSTLSVNGQDSTSAFVSGLAKSVDAKPASSASSVFRALQLVAIDVSQKAIMDQLSLCTDLPAFLRQTSGTLALNDPRFIVTTHVTLAHTKDMSTEDMHQKYGSLVGNTVTVKATALLWDSQNAALAVVTDIPSPNEHPHITIWVNLSSEAAYSNELFKKDGVNRIDFDSPLEIAGTSTVTTNRVVCAMSVQDNASTEAPSVPTWTTYLPPGIREAVQQSKYRWCARESAMWGVATGTAMSLHRLRMRPSAVTTAINAGFLTFFVVYSGSYYFGVKRRDHQEKMIEMMMRLNSFQTVDEMPEQVPLDENHPFVAPGDEQGAGSKQYVANLPERKQWQAPLPTQDASDLFQREEK